MTEMFEGNGEYEQAMLESGTALRSTFMDNNGPIETSVFNLLFADESPKDDGYLYSDINLKSSMKQYFPDIYDGWVLHVGVSSGISFPLYAICYLTSSDETTDALKPIEYDGYILMVDENSKLCWYNSTTTDKIYMETPQGNNVECSIEKVTGTLPSQNLYRDKNNKIFTDIGATSELVISSGQISGGVYDNGGYKPAGTDTRYKVFIVNANSGYYPMFNTDNKLWVENPDGIICTVGEDGVLETTNYSVTNTNAN